MPEEKSYAPAVISMEERLAIVLYGGSSLAIYMNGVVQELLKLVRATAVAPADRPCLTPERRALLADEEIFDSEAVYRELGVMLPGVNVSEEDGRTLRRRFIVDILSGSSAGGINGIFLAKALVNNQKLDGLATLWVEEGDIELLLNDKKHVRSIPGLKLDKPVPSLLNGNRMYRKLLDALEGMEVDGRSTPNTKSNLVGELDLFTTSTDLLGLPLRMKLANGVAYERRYRNTFHFAYSNPELTGYKRHDFFADINPFMAFAARCTSSLPFVFEPMTLNDAHEMLGAYPAYDSKPWADLEERWKAFFLDYLKIEKVPFDAWPFGDGGSLDNSPFTQSTSELSQRRAEVPVRRTMFYVEPDPAKSAGNVEGGRPDAVQNLLKQGVILPREQTIAEDLQRIAARNVLIRRVNEVLEQLDQQDSFGAKRPRSDWADRAADDSERTPSYQAYQELKVRSVVDDLALLIARVANFQEDSDELEAIRALIKEWVAIRYPKVVESPEAEGERDFLMDFDIRYRIRRVLFVQRKVDRVHRLDEDAMNVLRRSIGWTPEEEDKKPFRDELLRLKCELAEIQARLLACWYDLSLARDSEKNPTPIGKLIAATKIGYRELNRILEAPIPKRRAEAMAILKPRTEAFEALGRYVAERLMEVFSGPLGAGRRWRELIAEGLDQAGNPARRAREFLNYYYERFDNFDSLAFPIQYGTGAGESAEVSVLRISPHDASQFNVGPKREVGGLKYGHFGAFFSRAWRENDILCGRLDAAQILIDSFGPEDEARKNDMLVRATRSIVLNCLGRMERTSLDPELVKWAETPESGAVVGGKA